MSAERITRVEVDPGASDTLRALLREFPTSESEYTQIRKSLVRVAKRKPEALSAVSFELCEALQYESANEDSHIAETVAELAPYATEALTPVAAWLENAITSGSDQQRAYALETVRRIGRVEPSLVTPSLPVSRQQVDRTLAEYLTAVGAVGSQDPSAVAGEIPTIIDIVEPDPDTGDGDEVTSAARAIASLARGDVDRVAAAVGPLDRRLTATEDTVQSEESDEADANPLTGTDTGSDDRSGAFVDAFRFDDGSQTNDPGRMRQATIEALRAIGTEDPSLLAPVVERQTARLTHTDPSTRVDALETLTELTVKNGHVAAPVVETLAGHVDDVDAVRRELPRALSAIAITPAADCAYTQPPSTGLQTLLSERGLTPVELREPTVDRDLAPGVVQSLAAFLRDSRDTGVEQALEHLGRIGHYEPDLVTPVSDDIVAQTDAENVDVRRTALEAVGLIGRTDAAVVESAIDPLRECLETMELDRDHGSSALREAFESTTETTTAEPREARDDEDDTTDETAPADETVDEARTENDDTANSLAEELFGCESDDDPLSGLKARTLRETAAQVVGCLGTCDPGVVAPLIPALIDRLDDPDEEPRRYAAAALAHIGEQNPQLVSDAVVPLYETATADGPFPPDTLLELIASEDGRVLTPLVGELVDDLPSPRGSSRSGGYVSPSTSHVLGEIGADAPTAIQPALHQWRALLAEDDARHAEPIAGIGTVGTAHPQVVAGFVPRIVERLDSPDRDTRQQAVRALGRIGRADPGLVSGHVSALAGRLDDDDRRTRKAAVEAIEAIAESDASLVAQTVRPLARLLTSPGPRAAAMAALATIAEADAAYVETVSPAIGDRLEDANESVLVETLRAVDALGAKKWETALAELTDHPDEEVRDTATRLQQSTG